MSVSIDLIRQRWAEPAGFSLARPAGAECYILLHFLTPVELTFDSETRPAPRGALIVFSPGKPHSFYSREPLVHDWMHLSGDVDAMMADYGLMPDTLYLPGVESVVSEITGFLEAEFFTRRAYWPELSEVKLRELFIRRAEPEGYAAAHARARGNGGPAAAGARADACAARAGMDGRGDRGARESQPFAAARGV